MKGTAHAEKGGTARWLKLPPGPDPARPHFHRPGANDDAGVPAIADLLPSLPYWDAAGRNRRAAQQRGMKAVLGWLEMFPGPGWQARWLAAEADHLPWSSRAQGMLPIPGPRPAVISALRPMLLLRVITPAYGFFGTYRASAVLQDAWTTLSSDDARQRAEQALDELAVFGRHRFDVIKALAKLVLHTGKSIDDLEPEDLFEFRSWGIAHGAATPGLHGAWEVACRIGAIPGGKTLRGALREGPRPTEELVGRYGLENRDVRDLLTRYLNERRPALDYSSFLNLTGILAGTFWGDLERHHPDLHTIRLPADIAEAWKKRLENRTDWRTGRQHPRSVSDQMGIKVKVRAFYLDIQKWAPEDPSWAPWAVPCPIRKSEVTGLAKMRREVSARMHQRIRERLPRLGELVEAAESWRAEQTALLAAAAAAAGGEAFEHQGRAYQRHVPQTYKTGPYSRRLGVPDVAVLDLATGDQVNVSTAEENAFWAWAVIEILRHSGIRLEELLELTHLALVSYRLPGPGEIVPLLQIVPSKTNQERLLLVPPELASVLAEIITRQRRDDGRIPLVARYDPYERVTGPPLPHLLQRRRGWRRETLTGAYIYRVLASVIQRAGICNAAGQPVRYTPHDFRRVFATDAVTGGLPVHIAAKILGHEHLGTTEHYLAVFQDDLIRNYQAFLSRRRAARPAEEYREPTDQEWADFKEHFLLRRVELGTCGRPYQSPCQHEFACVRCPMLQVDPRQRPRLAEIAASLSARITEAEQHGWHGEAQGLRASLGAAQAKLAAVDKRGRTQLGIPAIRPGLTTPRPT